jgi:hypothetical protein
MPSVVKAYPMPTLDEEHVSETGEYRRALRAIGTALDALTLKAFEITYSAPNYIMRLEVQRETPEVMHVLARMLKSLKRLFHRRYLENNSSTTLELIYTPKQIQKLEQENQLRLRKGTAYPHSLARTLARIGAYVELKGADLVQISSRDGCFTVQYATALDHCITERLSTASWYDFLWLALRSGARSGRIDGRDWALDFKSKHRLRSAQRKWRPAVKSSIKG